MNELKKITNKEILFKDNYISYTKSMIHLPIFCVSSGKAADADDLYTLKLSKFEGFKDIKFRFPLLSIKTDFMIFTYVIKIFYENCENGAENPYLIDFYFKDFYDYFKIVRNNRFSFSKTIDASIEKLADIKLTFDRGDIKYFCNFINLATIDKKQKRKYHFELQKEFLGFFKHDPDLIFNINIDNYIMLDKDFSKILYLFYITNIHKIGKDNVASFDRDLIFTRLQSASKTDKKILELIREANQELIDKKLIKGFSFSKSGNRITKINIKYFSKNANEAIEEAKQEEQKEEKKEEPKRSIGLFDNIKKIERDFPKNENMGEK